MNLRDEQKAKSKAAITRSAAKLVCERGIEGTGVQEVMKGAGLTVGAFYAHFKDKDEMLKLGIEAALADLSEVLTEREAIPDGRQALFKVVDFYLAEMHRDQPGNGCPMPASLGSAVSRETSALHRKMLADAFEVFRKRVTRVGKGAVDADRMLGLLSTLIGAQVIARATRGRPISKRVLRSTEKFLKASF